MGGGRHPHHHHHHHHHHHRHHHHEHPHRGAFSGGLNDEELVAAQLALSKLSGLGGSSPVVPFSRLSDVTPGGGVSQFSPLKPLSSGLVTGQGKDTYAGGVDSNRFAISKFASDTVLGGSTAGRGSHVEKTGAFRLSGDTINIAGITAVGVKATDPNSSPHSSHTITLSDKTTLTITGVHVNEIIKPHGH